VRGSEPTLGLMGRSIERGVGSGILGFRPIHESTDSSRRESREGRSQSPKEIVQLISEGPADRGIHPWERDRMTGVARHIHPSD
jgi:hypothetical protein